MIERFRNGFALALLLLANQACRQTARDSNRQQAFSLDGVKLDAGDIIFRRTDGLLGTLVLQSDGVSDFSHVGIVVSVVPQAFVVHAVPASGRRIRGGVERVSLVDFITDPTVTGVAVYRLQQKNGAATQRAVSWALGQARRHTPFDGLLNLSDTTAAYCTELVWRAYHNAGITLVNPARVYLSMPFNHDSVILVSALAESPKLELVVRRFIPKLSEK